MLNTKYISSRQIINNLYRDTQLEYEIPFSDVVDWIADALDKINYPLQYISKTTGSKDNPDLDILDYKAAIPCDFHKLRAIAVNGFPARPATGLFHSMLDGKCCDFDIPQGDIDIFTDNFGNKFSPQLGQNPNIVYPGEITFDINNDFITLSVKEGKVCMAYLAYPLDNEGYPLIPDEIYYKEAVKWYLTYKLDYIQWRLDPLNKGKQELYRTSEAEWLFYCPAAQNSAKMPDVGQMENMKNLLLSFKKRFDHFSTGFRGLGNPEYRKNY